jgi:type I restriction enzyme S subunit
VEFKELGEIAQILNGYAFQSSKYTEKGIRVIRISDVQKGKMSDKDLKFYPLETKEEIERYLLKNNDLVMSLTGNVGRVAMLSESDLPAGLNQRVACIRSKSNDLLTRFLFHFFDQDSFETEAMANATGGGQKNLSTTWLSKFKIPLPPLAVQQEIVRILDSFTELKAELEAELEARKKQYEFYRDELLST